MDQSNATGFDNTFVSLIYKLLKILLFYRIQFITRRIKETWINNNVFPNLYCFKFLQYYFVIKDNFSIIFNINYFIFNISLTLMFSKIRSFIKKILFYIFDLHTFVWGATSILYVLYTFRHTFYINIILLCVFILCM